MNIEEDKQDLLQAEDRAEPDQVEALEPGVPEAAPAAVPPAKAPDKVKRKQEVDIRLDDRSWWGATALQDTDVVTAENENLLLRVLGEDCVPAQGLEDQAAGPAQGMDDQDTDVGTDKEASGNRDTHDKNDEFQTNEKNIQAFH